MQTMLNIYQFDCGIYVCSSAYVSDWIQCFSSASIHEWIFRICFFNLQHRPILFYIHCWLNSVTFLQVLMQLTYLGTKYAKRCLSSYVLHESLSLFHSSSTPVVYLFHKLIMLWKYVHVMHVGLVNTYAMYSSLAWKTYLTKKALNWDSTRLLSAACIFCSIAHVRIEFNVHSGTGWPFWPSLCSNIYLLLVSPFCVKLIIRYFRRWRNSVRSLGRTCIIGNVPILQIVKHL